VTRLVLLLAMLVAVFVPATPAAASTDCSVTAGDLSWGFKESFRSYISGTIANGEWSVADGATYETPLFGFTRATGSYDSGVGEISFAGSITFTGHDGILNTTVANPAIRFVDADTAYLMLDVSGTTQQGEAVAEQAVKFVRLDLPAATVTGSTVTFTAAAAELTTDGSAAFGTYEADEPFDPVTVSLTTEAGCADVPLPINEDATPPTSPENTWIVWLGVGIAALAAIGVVLVRLARR
jgi:large repetitive protein